MGERLSDIEEYRLQLSHIHGKIEGLQSASKHLKNKSSQAFLKYKEDEAKLLRTLASHFYQDVEVLMVEKKKIFDKIQKENEENK